MAGLRPSRGRNVGAGTYPAGVTRPAQTLDIHIAAWPPERWDEIDAIRSGPHPDAWRGKRRPRITAESIDWAALGLTPRWLGDDSSEAVAAVDPSLFHDSGAQEWRRLVAGAAARGELVLAASMIGSDKEPEYVPLGGPHASVMLPAASLTRVGGQQIALASRPDPAPGLGRADRDLALRIADTRPGELPWWRLSMAGLQTERAFGESEVHQAEGTLAPLLLSRAGEPVAAIWTSPDGAVRHYLLPFLPSWVPVLDWLVQQAIPEFVPSAARRIRSSLAAEPTLQTAAEAAAHAQLAQLDAEYQARRAELAARVEDAARRADEVRDPLLYGSGTPLVAAVTRVLTDAAIAVHDVDELLGDTSNADLLAEHGGRRVLVEVKSSGGAPSERLAEAPARHLATWPRLRPDLPADDVVLVLNHQTNTHPLDRDAAPYRRPEFVASLPFSVLTTRQLFDWWRSGDHPAVRAAVFGTAAHVATSGRPSTGDQSPLSRKRRRLFDRR
jgi:hypothetical protein